MLDSLVVSRLLKQNYTGCEVFPKLFIFWIQNSKSVVENHEKRVEVSQTWDRFFRAAFDRIWLTSTKVLRVFRIRFCLWYKKWKVREKLHRLCSFGPKCDWMQANTKSGFSVNIFLYWEIFVTTCLDPVSSGPKTSSGRGGGPIILSKSNYPPWRTGSAVLHWK